MAGPILDQCVLLKRWKKKQLTIIQHFLLTVAYLCKKKLVRSFSWDSHGEWIFDTNTDMSCFPGFFPVCVISLQADYRPCVPIKHLVYMFHI